MRFEISLAVSVAFLLGYLLAVLHRHVAPRLGPSHPVTRGCPCAVCITELNAESLHERRFFGPVPSATAATLLETPVVSERGRTVSLRQSSAPTIPVQYVDAFEDERGLIVT